MSALPDFMTDILAPIQARQSHVGRMAESLAGIVTDLLNKHEPLLKAECDGVEITVTEKGGSLAFSLCIEPIRIATTREAGSPNKQPASNS